MPVQSPNLTHLCLVDADVSLATLQRFLWASHETLQHLHIIALFFVEESDISIQAPPLPHLQKIWVRLLNEQPRQSAKLLRWLLLSPDLEAICLNMSSGPYDAALELLLQALPTRWPLLRELCWSLHPDRGVSQALADLVHRRRLAFHSEGRHNAACFKAVNTVIDRRYT